MNLLSQLLYMVSRKSAGAGSGVGGRHPGEIEFLIMARTQQSMVRLTGLLEENRCVPQLAESQKLGLGMAG